MAWSLAAVAGVARGGTTSMGGGAVAARRVARAEWTAAAAAGAARRRLATAPSATVAAPHSERLMSLRFPPSRAANAFARGLPPIRVAAGVGAAPADSAAPAAPSDPDPATTEAELELARRMLPGGEFSNAKELHQVRVRDVRWSHAARARAWRKALTHARRP